MKLIPTTSTSVETLKSTARTLQSTTGTHYMAALDTVARAAGYECWNHVQWCAKQAAPAGTSDGEKRAEATRTEARQDGGLGTAENVDAAAASAEAAPSGEPKDLPLVDENRRYMDLLVERARGASVERFPARGAVFHSVEIDGACFIGFAGPYDVFVIRRSRRLRGQDEGGVQIGGASIHVVEPTALERWAKGWHICKRGPQEPRVEIEDLSPAARHALAYEFGVPIHLPPGAASSYQEMYPPESAVLFYLSPAFASLCAMAKRQPRKARGWHGSLLLPGWGEAARQGCPPWRVKFHHGRTHSANSPGGRR